MHIAIVEDQAADRETLRGHLQALFEGGPSMIREFDSGEAFLKDYAPGLYDLLFLDCCLKGVNGMDVARAVRSAGDACEIYFATSSRDFAVDGYEVRASGYLVKPYTRDQLARQLRFLAREQPFIELGGRKLTLSHIAWCAMDGHYAQVHLVGREALQVRLTFKELTETFARWPQFLVCCRGVLVNLEQVKSLETDCFLLYNGDRAPIRQRDQREILQAYADYHFRKARGEIR